MNILLNYLTPDTDPSFLPRGSSNSTPHQSPGANSVLPKKRRVPGLLPWLLMTITRSPGRRSLKGGFLIRELVLPAGEIALTVESPPARGDRVNLVNRENTPRFASHWKQRTPATEPSFFPKISQIIEIYRNNQ